MVLERRPTIVIAPRGRPSTPLARRLAWLLAPLIMVVVLGVGGSSLAQVVSAAAPDDATATTELESPEGVREMVARLSDQEVRSLLLDRLDAAAGSEQTARQDAGLVELLETATTGVAQSIADAVARTPLLWATMSESVARFLERIGPDGLWLIAVTMGVAIVGGLLAEQLFDRACRRWLPPPPDSGESLGASMKFLLHRLVQDILGVVVFILVAGWIGEAIGHGFFGDRPNIQTVGAYAELFWYTAIVVPRLAAAFSRFILAPRRPELRLVHTDDETARFLHRNQIGVFALVGFTFFLISFNEMNGVAVGEAKLGFWLSLAVHLYIVYIAWRARDGLVMMMRGPSEDVTPTEERVARAYPWFAIAVSIGSWWLTEILAAAKAWDVLAGAPQIWTMVLFLMAPSMDTVVRSLVRHLTPPMTGDGALAERAYHATKRSYIRIGRVLVFFIVFVAIAEIWGLDLENVAAQGVGAQLAGSLIEFMLTIAIGYFVWELIGLWFNRKLAAEQTVQGIDLSAEEPGGGEGGGVGGSRLSTVLPLAHGAAKAAVAVIFALLALGHLGIDITPLLAGAGIVGLAIGFGAQKLVADVVSGIFFLIDDAFRTGEYVDVEGTVGTVEKISIRSMQLRHHRGAIHTIPFGEIPKLTNYSRDWVIMKLKFTVPFDTDPMLVKKLFKQIGKEMESAPEFAADMLQPFKSQGVFDFDDVGMIVRGKFMAKPGTQFTLRKEIYNRVKAAFDANGIEFARREVRVALPGRAGDPELTEEDREAIAAAAGEAARASLEAQGPPEKTPV